MKIKLSIRDGLDIDTAGDTSWTTVILAAGVAVSLALYAWSYI